MKRFAAFVVALSIVPVIAQDAPRREPPSAMLSVVVTDARGNHVTSLTKDDFDVTMGRTPITVSRFSERGAGGAYAGEMRRIAVLFDPSTLSGSARKQATEALHAFLARTLRPGDMAAILGGGASLRPVTGWTSDLNEIDNALRLVA